jgi:hypothetical protein
MGLAEGLRDERVEARVAASASGSYITTRLEFLDELA